MQIKPTVSSITIYPVKSLDGISLQKAQVSKGGCLLHDREYAILNNDGRFINGKSNALVHTLRSTIDFEKDIIVFRDETAATWDSFHLQNEKAAIDNYLSEFFKIKATLAKNTEGRFLDMPDFSGVTLLSTSSLKSVSSWFNEMDIDETRKRFRATIEISNMPAFWEDHLFTEEGTAVEFTTGEVRMMGMAPRARCVVPTRHPQTGEVIHAFPKIFAGHRSSDLPDWSVLQEYGHGYYLTVDCHLPASETGKWINVGDEINITGNKIFHTSLGF